jgi:hypothetical protein
MVANPAAWRSDGLVLLTLSVMTLCGEGICFGSNLCALVDIRAR